MNKQIEIVAEYKVEEKDGIFYAEIPGLINVNDKTKDKAVIKLNNFYNFLVAGWRNRDQFEENLIKNDFKKSKNGWDKISDSDCPSLRIFFNEND